jgi:hypothetical protein
MRSTANRTASLTDSLIDRPLKCAGAHQNHAKKSQLKKGEQSYCDFRQQTAVAASLQACYLFYNWCKQ